MNKKKIISFLFTSLQIFILMMLSLFLFWEAIGKPHVEKYIKENYGHAILETNNNSKLSLELLKNDT